MRSAIDARAIMAGLVALLFCALWLTGAQLSNRAESTAAALPAPRYDVPRHVRYGFTLRNTTNQVLKNAQFWTYAPVQQTSTQHCCERLEASVPHTVQVDPFGNQVMHFRLAELGPYASEVIQINADLRLAEIPNTLPVKDIGVYLPEERFVEVSDPKIKALASRVREENSRGIAQETFNLVRGSLRYSGYVRNDRGALHALTTGRGDCTEFMYLFMALARANGVPARGIGGYVYAKDAILRAQDYHNWAEFYADDAWRIADAQKGIFQPEQPSYIAMRVLGESGTDTISDAHRFWHSENGLEVHMN